MKKLYYIAAFLILLSGCKSWQKTATNETRNISVKKLIKNVDNQRFSAQTFESRFNVEYTDNNQSMTGSGRIKILKDSIIWGSINFLGIPVVKFHITPNKIRYYNKLQQEYYDGDYSFIKQRFGYDLNFYHLQNLLLGDLLVDIPFQDYDLVVKKNYYRLTTQNNYLLKSLKITPFYKVLFENLKDRNNTQLHIKYVDYQKLEKENIPRDIQFKTFNTQKDIQVKIMYKKPVINQKLRFPFKIPEGYSPAL